MAYSTAQRQQILTNLGWRVNTGARYVQAVRDFQRGWNLGTALVIDGAPGPKTDAALAVSELRRRQGAGTASAHFSFTEFRCKCGGRYTDCRRIWQTRQSIQALEKYRTAFGATSIISGCRCPGHNRAVGGASSSQHMAGTAADLSGRHSTSRVRSLGAFTGLGYKGSTGLVQHGDTRPGSTSSPVTWRYA
jgi:hypothetical protein